jgi:hypothetical protein
MQVPATWSQARDHCSFMGGNLVQVFSPDLQGLFDREANGNDYWTALNDIRQEGNYEWENTLGLPIPLGHAWDNWAPGQPAPDSQHQKNCMAVLHNGTRSGKWYEIDCQTMMPYVCQRRARNTDQDRLWPGLWKVEYQTAFNNQSVFNKSCLVQVYAQTDLQAFYGFTTDDSSQFNDVPVAEPSAKSTTNRYVANITNMDWGARVANVEFYEISNYSLIDSQRLRYRQNCSYNIYSDPFSCAANGYTMMVTGHDENGFLFNRYEYGVCVGGPRQTEADYGLPQKTWFWQE